jgi:hypothetical protein
VIIGTEFAWGHLPKTGGDATTALFQLFPELVEHADPTEAGDKHAPFRDRAELVDGKPRALNLRRLPAWTLSLSLHVSFHGDPDFPPMPMRSPQEMAESPLGDANLVPFLDAPIEHWLRMEMLVDDFLQLAARYVDVDDERRERAYALPRVNWMSYDHKLSNWFTQEQIDLMYESNPAWAQVEQALYGELVSLASPACA